LKKVYKLYYRKKKEKNKPRLEKLDEKVANPLADNNNEEIDKCFNSAKRKNIAENAKI